MAWALPSYFQATGLGGGMAPPPGNSVVSADGWPRGASATFLSCARSVSRVPMANSMAQIAAVSATRRRLVRKRENIKHPSGRGALLQILGDADHAQRAGGVLWIEVARHDRTGPAADPGQHRDLFVAVRGFERDRLTDDSGAGLELPFEFAGLGIDGFEPAVQRAVEHEAARGRERAAPHRQILLYLPDRLTCLGVPRRHFAAIAARSR